MGKKWKWRAFLEGFWSVFDISGVQSRRRYEELSKEVLGNLPKTDEEAIRRDWEAVAGDMRKAIERVEAKRKDDSC